MTEMGNKMAKRCKTCKKTFTPMNSLQPTCSPVCAIAFTKTKQGKAHVDKAREREHTDKKRAFNKTDIPKQLKLTQKAFNKMRVLEELLWFKSRGIEPECISCGKTNMDWCCGHFKSVGAQSTLRFNPRNTFLQCNRYCNMGLSANIEGNKTTRGYKQGLRDRFGDTEGGFILAYCEQHTGIINWTGDMLKEMRAGFNKRIRELQNGSN